MNATLVVAAEAGHVPPEHVAANFAVVIGFMLFSGSVYLLLWSNYGAKKAAAIYGTAFFAFTFFVGVFSWFGAPGTPVAATGPQNFPGQPQNQYQARWYPFEAGSERASFFPVANSPANFVTVPEFTSVPPEQIEADPYAAFLAGDLQGAADTMVGLYLPTDATGNAQIGADRRAGYEEVIADVDLPEGATRALPFFTAAVQELRVVEDDGSLVAAALLQTFANFTDAEGAPLDPVPVDGDGVWWFAVKDPGAIWFPSAVWTLLALALFGASLFALDRLEQRDKRRATEVAEPEDVAVPVAQ